jgi:hypothetical protein
MARSRNIKPGFFTNDVLAELPPLARLLFAGLWTHCDREGRCEDRPKKIKAEILPYDECDADQLLEGLRKSGFIDRYVVGELRVIQVLTWDKHQNPHMKEAASTLPARNEHGASTVQAPDKAQPEPERAGLIPSSLIPDSLSLDSLKGKPRAKRAAPPPERPAEVSEQVWEDWLALRAKKRATVSATVLDAAITEAAKADMTLEDFLRVWCLRGSQGLEASWLKPEERAQGRPPPESFRERDLRIARERYEEAVGIRRPAPATEIVEEVPRATPRLVGR